LFNGCSPAELAAKVAVTRQYIHSIEIDERTPRADLVSAFAVVLHVDSAFFYNSVSADIADNDCYFRSRKTTPAFVRQQCIARGALFDELVRQLDRDVPLQPVNVMPVEAPNSASIEAISLAHRTHWKLGEGPISNMCRAVEQRAGAVVTSFPGISEKVDAFSISRPRPIVVRNPTKESGARQRFDLAHELGHLILHAGFEADEGGDNDFVEDQANAFASAFLLPRRPFIAEFPKEVPLNWSALYALKLRWGVSVAAILRRALDLDLIDPAQYRVAYMRLSKTGQRKHENLDDQIPVEQPELIRASLALYEKLPGKSISRLADQLGMTPLFLRRLAGIEVVSNDEWENDPSIVNLANYRDARRVAS
jgi:Zn-dependent peptidase ImmA (M78 family)/transcriptional regulator with XRE-family HTH domain